MEHALPFRTRLVTARGRAMTYGSQRRTRKVTQHYARLTEPFVDTGRRYIATDEIPPEMDDLYGWEIGCIWVAGPYRSRTETYEIESGALLAVSIVNEEGWIQWGRTPGGAPFHHEGLFPLDPHGRHVEIWEFPHHTQETLLLIHPDWILHGYEPDWESATPVRILDRPAN